MFERRYPLSSTLQTGTEQIYECLAEIEEDADTTSGTIGLTKANPEDTMTMFRYFYNEFLIECAILIGCTIDELGYCLPEYCCRIGVSRGEFFKHVLMKVVTDECRTCFVDTIRSVAMERGVALVDTHSGATC